MQNKQAKGLLIAVLALIGVGILIALGVSGASQSGTTLNATKTITSHFTHTFGWTIEKSVTPSTWDLWRGDSGTSRYTISVVKDAGVDATWVDGEICVTNGGSFATDNLAITDDLFLQPNTPIILGQVVDVSSNPVLDPGETGCYGYSLNIPSPVPGGTYKETAHITITNHAGWIPGGNNCPGPDVCAFGPNPSASTILQSTPTLINDSINVNDTNGQQFQFSDTNSAFYEQTFVCDRDRGAHPNTATIVETNQQSSASVAVNCHTLEVIKNVNTRFDRTYEWIVGKVADQTNLILALGQSFPVNYSVPTNISIETDSDWEANGTITITNPAPIAATITNVTDSISAPELTPTLSPTAAAASIPANVDCDTALPFVLAAGASHECPYNALLPNADTRENVAGVSIRNSSYGGLDITPTAAAILPSTTFVSSPVSINFASAIINRIHSIVNLIDSLQGALATVNFDQQLPYAANYTSQIGPYNICGIYNINNIASVIPTDAQIAQDIAEWNVLVSVPCRTGCTLTIGYWKTHSGFSKGNQDDMITSLLPVLLGTSGGVKSINVTAAAQAVQFLSFNGSNNVFDGSNGINKLYAQLLAAKLNIKSGAAPAAVASTIAAADNFLANKNSLDWASLNKATKNTVLSWMNTLDKFNNGLIGPGHCSEPTVAAS